LTTPEPFAAGEATLTAFSLLAAALVIIRHRSNLARLSRGEENRVSDSPRLMMLARILHLLAVGLWFGSVTLFTFVVGLTLFHTFEGLEGQRLDWLSLTAPLTKEQGTRLAGIAVSPMFPQYFALQGACGLVALITAWGWSRSYPGRVHRVRFGVIAVGVLLVLAGWPLVAKIEALRFARYASDEAVAGPARAAFGLWHTVSLLLNLAVWILVAVALGLAARLPADQAVPAPEKAG
jgi:hypothetical protein